MDFLELQQHFESKIKSDFELLELHYTPYAFGSGMFAYRIKGQIFKAIYDGKDNLVELLISKPHEKYSDALWTTIYSGNSTNFIEKLLDILDVGV